MRIHTDVKKKSTQKGETKAIIYVILIAHAECVKDKKKT